MIQACIMQVEQKKKKFSLLDFASQTRGNIIANEITSSKQLLGCICGRGDNKKQSCFRCGSLTHICLQKEPNREDAFQCASCLNIMMDPLHQVRKVLVQSYFSFYNVFSTSNETAFMFSLTVEDLGYPVEIRGLRLSQVILSWPMTGCFFINAEKEPFYELKPLIVNSSRKGRKEEYIIIPKDNLKSGKNVLRFKIYCIDKERFINKYQYEEKGTYFFAINSINKLKPDELVSQTFRQRRIDVAASMAFLNLVTSEVEVTKNKVALICPFTKERIKIPVRGRYCRHYSCVCLLTLVAYHSTFRSWACPICDCLLNQPFVDIFIYKILKDNNKQGQEVVIDHNGNYEWVKAPQRTINVDQTDSEELSKDQESSAPEVIPPQQQLQVDVEIPPQSTQSIVASRQEEKERSKKETIEIIKSKLMEKLAQAPSAVSRTGLQPRQEEKLKKKDSNSELAKNKINEVPAKPRALVVDIKVLECTETHQKSYISKMFFGKSETFKGKSGLTKQHWDQIKKYGELKNLFVEIK